MYTYSFYGSHKRLDVAVGFSWLNFHENNPFLIHSHGTIWSLMLDLDEKLGE